jgi:ribosomal protein S19
MILPQMVYLTIAVHVTVVNMSQFRERRHGHKSSGEFAGTCTVRHVLTRKAKRYGL